MCVYACCHWESDGERRCMCVCVGEKDKERGSVHVYAYLYQKFDAAHVENWFSSASKENQTT